MAFNLPVPAPHLDIPLSGFRFGVFFLGKLGISHPLDFRFQSVSGLSIGVELVKEGNSATRSNDLPERVSYSNLVLKRGMPLLSTLSMELQDSFQRFRFSPRDVLVSILDENALPLSSWLFSKAYPVKWSLSTLDADSSAVLIEEIELSYTDFKPLTL